MGKYTAESRLWYRLETALKKAVREYRLIEDGDHLLIGLSGGKDSLALVELLGRMSRILRPRFQVTAAHVVMENIPYQSDLDFLESHCRQAGVGLVVLRTRFDAATDSRKSPCFLCSWNRRKQLFQAAQSLGCQKLVLGHHRDDFLETLLMNMFFQGSIQAMAPSLQMDNFPMQIIRPLCLVDEADLEALARLRQYPAQLRSCPYERDSNRTAVREMLEMMETRFPGLKDSLWASMQHIYPQYLPILPPTESVLAAVKEADL